MACHTMHFTFSNSTNSEILHSRSWLLLSQPPTHHHRH